MCFATPSVGVADQTSLPRRNDYLNDYMYDATMVSCILLAYGAIDAAQSVYVARTLHMMSTVGLFRTLMYICSN